MRELIPTTGDNGEASCSKPQFEPDWWFDEDNPQLAQNICQECPLAVACLSYAINNNIEHGIWGAQTPEQRRKTKRK